MFVGYYAPGFWTYEENSIESGEEIPADRMEFVPSEDGTNLKSWLFESDLDYEFTEKFDRLDGKQNEYGFYFGEGYTFYNYNMNICKYFVVKYGEN